MTVAPLTEAESLSATIAKRIRGLLGEQGISQARLARDLGVSQMYVSDRIRIGGKTPIDVNDLQRIAALLGVPVIDLLPSAARVTPTARYPLAPVAAPHPVDVRSPRSRSRSRFGQRVAA